MSTDVRTALIQTSSHMAAGPDGILTAGRLAGVFTDIFYLSLRHANVPTGLKSTSMVPLPKHDYHSVALTAIGVTWHKNKSTGDPLRCTVLRSSTVILSKLTNKHGDQGISTSLCNRMRCQATPAPPSASSTPAACAWLQLHGQVCRCHHGDQHHLSQQREPPAGWSCSTWLFGVLTKTCSLWTVKKDKNQQTQEQLLNSAPR